MEFLKQDSFERISQVRNLDAVDDILGERVDQEAARLVLADAAGPQIEERLGVQLADGGAVGAAHVVGENLQLGFGIDDRVVGEDQVLVGLLGIGLLGVLADNDAAVENRVGFAVQNPLVEFVAGAVRLGMIDDGVVVGEIGQA